VRVNFNYFISEPVFRFMIEAVHLVASEGWKLLPQYRFSIDSGLWRHHDQPRFKEFGLDDLTFESGSLVYRGRHLTEPESALEQYLENARRIIAEADGESEAESATAALPEELEWLRWFPLPVVALTDATGGTTEKTDSSDVTSDRRST